MKKLTATQTPPDFSVQDVFDRPIRLHDYKGKKILLSFYRHTSCPFCNLRVHQLMKKYPEWKDKIQMIFFFESKKEVILRSTFHVELSPIPIISDPQKQYYELFGVETSLLKSIATAFAPQMSAHMKAAKEVGFVPAVGGKFSEGAGDSTIPADFLIDENMVIKKAYYGKVVFDHLPIPEIEAFVNA